MRQHAAQFFSGIYMLLIVLLVNLLPFVVSHEYVYPAQIPKTLLFLFALPVILSLFIISLFLQKKTIRFSITVIDAAIALLFLYILLNRYLLHTTYGFSVRFYELWGLGVLYTIIRATPTRYYPFFLLSLAGSGLLQAIYGNLQLYGFYPSHHTNFAVTGGFFNPGPYSGFLAGIFPVALGIYLSSSHLFNKARLEKWNRYCSSAISWFAFLAVISIMLILSSAQSRAAFLAVAVGGSYLLWKKYELKTWISAKFNTPFKKITAICLAGTLIIASMATLYMIKKDSADGRLLIWQATGQLALAHPVTGIGFDRFQARYMNAQARWFQDHPQSDFAPLAGNTQYAFNEVLQFVTEEGVAGLALLLILGVFIIRTTSPEAEIGWLTMSKAGILALAVFALFSYPSDILPIKLSGTILLAITASYRAKCISFRLPQPDHSETWIKIAALCLVVGASIYSFLDLVRWQKAAKEWGSALQAYRSERISPSIKTYASAYPVFRRKGDFLVNYGKALSMAEADTMAINILTQAQRYHNNSIVQTALGDSYKRQHAYAKAEQAYWQASYMLPDRFYPKYLLVKLYDATGQKNNARRLARKLIRKKPKISSPAVRQIKEKMRQLLKEYH